jgi:hypothetical protein
MDTKIAAFLLLFVGLIFSQYSKAEAIAQMPNEGGGFIVLTDDECKHDGKVYKGLNRLYSYTQQGYNNEGCYGVEDQIVVAIWKTGTKMRYPISSFTLLKKAKGYSV